MNKEQFEARIKELLPQTTEQALNAWTECDVTRSVSKMTEIERRGGKRWDKPKKVGKSRDCRGGKF
jgi:hypothetical protein